MKVLGIIFIFLNCVLLSSSQKITTSFDPEAKNFIPGKGCGIKTPIKESSKLPENEEDWPCTKITDEKEYIRS